VSRLCATKLSSTLVFITFLENEYKIPKQPRRIIYLISDFSAQLAFRGPYLLAPWSELTFHMSKLKISSRPTNLVVKLLPLEGV
jgi:hypothetical protein